MRLPVLILLFFVLVQAAGAVMITEIYPDTLLDGDPDEFVTLNGTGSLDGFALSDGEGVIRFPLGTVSPGRVVIAREAASFQQVWKTRPDYELKDTSPDVPQLPVTGSFQLANKKDELVLTRNDRIVQSVSWPDEIASRKGQVHLLGADGKWDERILMEGASRFDPLTVSNASGIMAVSPDCARELLEETILSAEEEILLDVYEFTDPGIAALLCERKAAGVNITVLMEGGPVGGITPEEKTVVARLSSAGIPVYLMSGTGMRAPYRYTHAKFLVTDRNALFLTTENVKPHSFPPPGRFGNRGWSVLVRSEPLAAYFARVFFEDLDGPGVAMSAGSPGPEDPLPAGSYAPSFACYPFTNATVTAVLSPDTSSLVSEMINHAEKRVWVQQAYIRKYPEGKEHPYLDAILSAARRGVEVRVLLDAYPYNVEDDADNDEMVDYLNGCAEREGLPLTARLIDLAGTGLLKVHTKGVIADGSALVSSINWNENSPTFNREAGLIIDHPGTASYLAAVYEKDWQGVGAPREAPMPGSGFEPVKIGLLAGVMALLVLFLLRKR